MAALRCAGRQQQAHGVPGATAHTPALLAKRILALTTDIDQLQRHIEDVIGRHWPQLLQRRGIGPDSAAALLITTGDNPDRLNSAAAFVALCGASPSRHPPATASADASTAAATAKPTPRSTTLSSAACTPTRPPAPTATGAEGKTKREIIRCLKRYVAREVFGLLAATS